MHRNPKLGARMPLGTSQGHRVRVGLVPDHNPAQTKQKHTKWN